MTTPEQLAAIEADTPKLVNLHADGKLNFLANFIACFCLIFLTLAVFALVALVFGAFHDLIRGQPFNLTPDIGWGEVATILGGLSISLATLHTILAALGTIFAGPRHGRK